MSPQALAELFAKVAKPRLLDLLKLKSVEHVYDPTPGRAPASFLYQGREISLKLHKTTQPYKDVLRFVSAEKVQAYILDPGLLPAVKSILTDVRGRRVLVTRRRGSEAMVRRMPASGIWMGLECALWCRSTQAMSGSLLGNVFMGWSEVLLISCARSDRQAGIFWELGIG